VFSFGLDINDILIIAFKAKRYVQKYESDWKSITALIQCDPTFSTFTLNAEKAEDIVTFISFYDIE
jgi:hypothetical protein